MKALKHEICFVSSYYKCDVTNSCPDIDIHNPSTGVDGSKPTQSIPYYGVSLDISNNKEPRLTVYSYPYNKNSTSEGGDEGGGGAMHQIILTEGIIKHHFEKDVNFYVDSENKKDKMKIYGRHFGRALKCGTSVVTINNNSDDSSSKNNNTHVDNTTAVSLRLKYLVGNAISFKGLSSFS